MRFYILVLYAAFSFFFIGCGEDVESGTTPSVASSWHFQGRDCLGCHNVDLQQKRNLLVGGTLFRDSNVSDVNDLSQNCGGNYVVEFLDSSYITKISSNNYEDLNSKGYQGKGNIFLLSRMLSTLNGDYYIRIKDRDSNLTIAQSMLPHSFNAQPYDINNAADLSNRNACNSCHQKVGKSGATGHLYAQFNLNLCK